MKKLLLSGLAALAVTLGLAVAPAAPAHANYADFLWVTCDSHAGLVVGTPTSCGFAHNVADRYLHGGPMVDIWSPATQLYYDMACSSGYVAHMAYGGTRLVALCQGGNDANVIVY
jgi:hypothetical protein